jgi:hypothetical protein
MIRQQEQGHRPHPWRVRRILATVLLVAFVSPGAEEALGQAGPPAPDPVEKAGCSRLVEYGTAKFDSNSHLVTHPLLPLAPGTQRVFEGRSNTTGAVLPHRVTFTVTSLTKVVDGVRTAVVWDVDESDGKLAETELATFAEDAAGNVWNLGEYPEEYPAGVFAGAPDTWFSGVGEAEPGIHMPKRPEVGPTEYVQGWVADIEFLDCAKIVESGASVCVPVGCFADVLVIHERSPFDPEGGIQVKYHAPGVGIVQIGAIGDPEGETLALTEVNTLSRSELRRANREAHILDQRGLQCSDVYAQTEPLKGPDDGDYGPYTCAPPEPPEPPPSTGGPTTSAPWSPPPADAVPANRPKAGYRDWVDHPLLPLRKVRTMLYKGRERGAGVRVESRVRGKRVRVAGVLATAVDITERENGKLVERSTDYYAQDRTGNVWYLGERVDDIENGKVTGHDGQWIAGRKGARRGLFMPAAPKVGQSFRQSRAPGVSRDRSTVVAVDAEVTTRAGRFTGCLKTRDTDLRGGSRPERKFYCPDVGLVREQPGNGIVDLVRFGLAAVPSSPRQGTPR